MQLRISNGLNFGFTPMDEMEEKGGEQMQAASSPLHASACRHTPSGLTEYRSTPMRTGACATSLPSFWALGPTASRSRPRAPSAYFVASPRPVSLPLRLARSVTHDELRRAHAAQSPARPPALHIRFVSPRSHSDALLIRTPVRPYGADPPPAPSMACSRTKYCTPSQRPRYSVPGNLHSRRSSSPTDPCTRAEPV
jgi:hypothetical protein